MKVVSLGATGRHMCEGEYEFLRAIYEVSPSFVPKPYAWGKYDKEDPETYFLLAEFRDVGEQVRITFFSVKACPSCQHVEVIKPRLILNLACRSNQAGSRPSGYTSTVQVSHWKVRLPHSYMPCANSASGQHMGRLLVCVVWEPPWACYGVGKTSASMARV